MLGERVEEEGRLDGRRRGKKKISVVKCSGEERGVERKTSSGQMRNEKTRDWRRCDLTCSAAITL